MGKIKASYMEAHIMLMDESDDGDATDTKNQSVPTSLGNTIAIRHAPKRPCPFYPSIVQLEEHQKSLTEDKRLLQIKCDNAEKKVEVVTHDNAKKTHRIADLEARIRELEVDLENHRVIIKLVEADKGKLTDLVMEGALTREVPPQIKELVCLQCHDQSELYETFELVFNSMIVDVTRSGLFGRLRDADVGICTDSFINVTSELILKLNMASPWFHNSEDGTGELWFYRDGVGIQQHRYRGIEDGMSCTSGMLNYMTHSLKQSNCQSAYVNHAAETSEILQIINNIERCAINIRKNMDEFHKIVSCIKRKLVEAEAL